MRTGRPAQPDVVKRIKGNRRKMKLAPAPGDAAPPLAPSVAAVADIAPLQSDGVAEGAQLLTPRHVEPPEFLTRPQERDIFQRIMVEFVPKQIARNTDAPAYARYAAYLARWIHCKMILDAPEAGDGFYWVESKHGKRMAQHPAFTMMMTCELAIVRLELQLGLTPLSRQSIMRGLGSLAGAAAAGLFGDQAAQPGRGEDVATPAEASPLGFLSDAASDIPPEKMN